MRPRQSETYVGRVRAAMLTKYIQADVICRRAGRHFTPEESASFASNMEGLVNRVRLWASSRKILDSIWLGSKNGEPPLPKRPPQSQPLHPEITLVRLTSQGALLLNNLLACQALGRNLKLYTILPKHHALTHVAYDVPINPRRNSCYQDEDMVGRGNRQAPRG